MSAEATFELLKLCSKAVNDLFNDRRDEIRYRPPPPTTSFHPIWRAQASKTIVATPTTVADRVAALAAVPIAHAPPPFGCWRPRGHLKPPCLRIVLPSSKAHNLPEAPPHTPQRVHYVRSPSAARRRRSQGAVVPPDAAPELLRTPLPTAQITDTC